MIDFFMLLWYNFFNVESYLYKSKFTKVSNMKIKKNTTGFINTSYSILTKNEFKAAIYEIGTNNNANVLEPVHIKIASKIIAKVRFPKYRTSSLS